ncbi:hypothetical protein MC885_009854 [Smutsia gigantea]|nr:hypothetical protein MC885_009854 [Smutsia gigantea]
MLLSSFKISLLTSAVNHLKASVKSAADLISLPATVEGLQKNQHLKETSRSSQMIPSPPATSELDNNTHSENLKQDILYLHNSLEEVNSALVGYQRQNDLKLEGMNKTVSNLTQRVSLVERGLVAARKVENHANLSFSTVSETLLTSDRAATLKRESLHQVTNRTDTVKTQSRKKEDSSDSQVSKLREKLQLISALTNKPDSSRPPETTDEEQVQSFTSKPSALPKSPQPLGDKSEKAAQLRPISLPGISSLKDLQDLFQTTDQDGKLTYQEIWNSLGSAMPEPESLREFDSDEDGRYSFLELRAALGI